MDETKKDNNIMQRLFNAHKNPEVNSEGQAEESVVRNVENASNSEDHLNKETAGGTTNTIGIDIGTSRIVSCKIGTDRKEVSQSELNAFFSIPLSPMTREILERNGMHYTELKNQLVVFGYDAQRFANMFNGELLHPMQEGLLKADEPNATHMIKEIITSLIKKPRELGQKLCFSIPSPRAGMESDLVFHEAILKKFFVGLGYNAFSVNEGLAVILSELASENYTGIGISIGAGMCNVCFSFLSVPVITYGLPCGGDLIDLSVSRVINESITRVRVIKEESLDLSRAPKNNLEQALHIYYDDMLSKIVNSLANTFSKSSNLPKLSQPIPLVLAGGPCIPNGFKTKFDKMLRYVELPLEISETRMAADPLRATARGALVYSK
ncbi:MAG: hypothetical protein HQK53_02585 [Oligoflexia bacterium]|nr:hypothetical protein [Oligoflexia bacterium]